MSFTISQGTLYIIIDEKPKRVAGPALKRVRNIVRHLPIRIEDVITFTGRTPDLVRDFRATAD